MRPYLMFALSCLFACQAEGPQVSPEETPKEDVMSTPEQDMPPDVEPVATSCAQEPGVVEFTTTDGVALKADYVPASKPGRGAVVLFHMIPPNFDRTSYPKRVRDAIHALDLNVLNVDRRGAGASAGVAEQAYLGETASLDVEAAVRFMLEREGGCAIDGERLALVGASNGTTSVWDYVVSPEDATLPRPRAIAWLSPGTYTESQHKLSDHRAEYDALPVLIVHPDNEPWATKLTDVSSLHKIVEIQGGGHGTRNFDDGAKESVQLPALLEWLESHVK